MSQVQIHPTIPSCMEDITPTWLSKILKTKITEKDFNIVTNVQAGNGFLSNMVRLTCKSDSKSYNLIIKFLPQDDIMNRLMLSEKFDKTEINFYEIVVPDLIKILPELKGYLCSSFYGHIQEEDPTLNHEYASVVVLEDLKPQGYYMINFTSEVTMEQVKEIVEFNAKLHFAGAALEDERKTPLNKVYDFLQGPYSKENSVFLEIAKQGYIDIDNIFAENSVSQDVRDAYQKLAPFSKKIMKIIDVEGKKFAGLIHGDLWSNNLLFNKNPNFHTKVIDWQLLAYKDPNFDLAVTIVANLPMSKLNKECVDQQLQLYYQSFKNLCDAAGLPHLVKRDLESFSKFFYSWGMTYTFLWFLMTIEGCSSNIPRLIKIFEFLAVDVGVPEFLLKQINNYNCN